MSMKRRGLTALRRAASGIGAALIAVAASACGGSDTDTGGTTSTTAQDPAAIQVFLTRDPNDILVTVRVTTAQGDPVDGLSPTVSAKDATVSDVTAKGSGQYVAKVFPNGVDREVPIDVDVSGLHASKTALLLSTIDPVWDQPEAISGLVNTPGWEDGASVSPDGEWLLIGTYVPIDIFTCGLGLGGDPALSPDSPSCNTVVGPYSGPERPDMLGAERIVSASEIQHSCPSLHFPPDGGETPFAVPPVAAYGFHRQADGSYAEPFVIGYGADGCLGPYGFSFAGAPSGKEADVLFANDDPLTQGAGDTAVDLYFTKVTLGEKNILAQYAWDGSKVAVTDVRPVRLPLPDLAGTQGNVNFVGGRLFWDDESAEGPARELYFADVTGALPDGPISAASVVGASRGNKEDIQPTFDGDALYWMGEGNIMYSILQAGGDPAGDAAWTVPVPMLGPDAMGGGEIIAVGEPTIAHVGPETWMYFVYIQKTAAGYDANVGRVRKR